jgi:hypothetical protein
MSTRVPLIALAALLLCAPSACTPSANPAHIASVDSLLLVTDSLTKGLHAMDLASLRALDSAYQPKKATVETLMRDTLNKEEAMILGNYHRNMTNRLSRALNDAGTVQEELTHTREQLENLKNDVTKGLLDASVENAYIGQERLAVAEVRRRASVLYSASKGVMLHHQRYSPLVDSLLRQHATPPTP